VGDASEAGRVNLDMAPGNGVVPPGPRGGNQTYRRVRRGVRQRPRDWRRQAWRSSADAAGRVAATAKSSFTAGPG